VTLQRVPLILLNISSQIFFTYRNFNHYVEFGFSLKAVNATLVIFTLFSTCLCESETGEQGFPDWCLSLKKEVKSYPSRDQVNIFFSLSRGGRQLFPDIFFQSVGLETKKASRFTIRATLLISFH
jgi:hypothetical protein